MKYFLSTILFILPLGTRLIVRHGPFEYATLSISAVGILILLLVAYAWSRKKIGRPPWPALLLVAWSALAIAWAPDQLIALQHVIYLALAVGLSVVILRPQAEGTRLPVYGFLAGAIIQSLLASWQFMTQKIIASTLLGVAAQDPQTLGVPVIEAYGGRVLRAFGTFPHPNILGGYLAIAGILALMALAREDKKKHRWFLEACFLLIQPGLMFSFSRAAWLAFVIGVLAVIILYHSSIRRIAPILFFSILIIASEWHRSPEFFHARFGPSRLNTISMNERSQYADDAKDLIAQHPVLGVGAGNFSIASIVSSRLHPGRPYYAYQPVHDTFALVLSELGPVGLVFLVSVLAIMLYSMIAVPAGLALIILMTTDHYLWSLPIGVLLFWTVLGLAGSSKKEITP